MLQFLKVRLRAKNEVLTVFRSLFQFHKVRLKVSKLGQFSATNEVSIP